MGTPPNMGAPGGIAHARGVGYHWPIQPGASPGHVQGDAVMADFTLPDGLLERRSERAAGYMCKGDELDGSTATPAAAVSTRPMQWLCTRSSANRRSASSAKPGRAWDRALPGDMRPRPMAGRWR